jgi:hypothetical protein
LWGSRKDLHKTNPEKFVSIYLRGRCSGEEHWQIGLLCNYRLSAAFALRGRFAFWTEADDSGRLREGERPRRNPSCHCYIGLRNPAPFT